MKYAIVNGQRVHVSKVKSGTIARAFGKSKGLVVAYVGQQKQYWKPFLL